MLFYQSYLHFATCLILKLMTTQKCHNFSRTQKPGLEKQNSFVRSKAKGFTVTCVKCAHEIYMSLSNSCLHLKTLTIKKLVRYMPSFKRDTVR